MDLSQQAKDASNTMLQTTGMGSQALLISSGITDHQEALYVVQCGVIGVLQTAAALCGQMDQDERPHPSTLVSPVTTLFAAILAAKMAPTSRPDGVSIAFGASVLFDTLEAVEKLCGKAEVEKYLHAPMLSAIRRMEHDATQPLQKLLEGRGPTPPTSTSLN